MTLAVFWTFMAFNAGFIWQQVQIRNLRRQVEKLEDIAPLTDPIDQDLARLKL
jgi:hypothetical protein